MVSFQLQVILLITSIIGLGIIIWLVSKTVLELKYTFIWISFSMITIFLSLFPNLLKEISELVGIQLPVNALFLFGFCFVFCIMFSLTAIASRNAQRVKVLNQELAILKNMVEEQQKHA